MKQLIHTLSRNIELNKRQNIIKNIFYFMQWFLTVYAILGNTNTILEKGYDVNIPVIKYGFVLLRYFDGWGIEKLFLAVGIGVIFYKARELPLVKNRWLRGFCLFLGICMVLGKSYLEYSSWDYIFKWWMQFIIAVFIIMGYYYLFLYSFAFCAAILQKRPNLFRTNTKNKIEFFLFESHPFKGAFLVSFLFLLPYIIAFFPGTLHYDALEQLWGYFGIIKMNGHHPVSSTLHMGSCIELGKRLFHSDSIGLFLYTGSNCIFQCLAIAYFMSFFKKINSPVLIRWAALAYFLIFPVFPMWSITFVKDTPYYILEIYFVTALANLIYSSNKHHPLPLRHKLIMVFSAFGMTLLRNNGVYIIVLTAIVLLLICRQSWKLWIVLATISLCTSLYMGKIYLPAQNIEAGELGEALSIPLQQTARYLSEHNDDISPEERNVLESLFNADLSIIAERYNPELSDPVKKLFTAHPSSQQLKAYFEVWGKQFLRHPDTYIQAYLNQYFGYYYPNKREAYQTDMLIFYLNGWEKWEDEYITIEHAIKNVTPRKFFENYCLSLYAMPIVGMLFSTGVNVYLLLGCAVYLLANKKNRQTAVLIPSLFTLLVCFASPIATLRYMLPIMAVWPLNAAWCIYSVSNDNIEKETISEIYL